MDNKIKTTMNVKDNLINIIRVNNIDYISLTDLARYKNPNNPGVKGLVTSVRFNWVFRRVYLDKMMPDY